jgi:membrane-bound inhibitor of C-type lysozyme
MATSLLDGLKSMVTPEFLSGAARNLGESEGAVATGLGAAFPAILAGIVAKAGDSQAMRPLFDLISSPANDGGVIRDPRLALTATPQSPLGAAAGKLLSGVFGGQSSPIGDWISRFAGFRSGSGSTLLSMAAPLVLGLLGNRVRTGGLNPGGLGNLLLAEKDSIMRALPAGLGSILGLKDVGISAPRIPAPSSKRWLVPALAALAVVLVVWALGRNRRPADQAGGEMAAGMAPPPADTAAAPAASDLKFVCGTENISFGHIGDRAVLTTSSGSFDLRPVTAASGAKYVAVTDSTTSFWNKGEKGTLKIKGTKYPECKAAK